MLGCNAQGVEQAHPHQLLLVGTWWARRVGQRLYTSSRQGHRTASRAGYANVLVRSATSLAPFLSLDMVALFYSLLLCVMLLLLLLLLEVERRK